ncbi:MAG: hypothetical protein CMJ83_11085 [Planctomycetes bacterium]|nr:hypothetical protein [Planctomycetota bacterium]
MRHSLLSMLVVTGLSTLLVPNAAAQVEQKVLGDIKAAVDAVSSAKIEATVRKLVSFGTRHTMSETKSETVGIGAARRWLKQHLETIAEETGGNLKISLERHALGASRRIPNGAEVVNVVATLPGTDPDRWVIVSGHYDSRASRGSDATSDAPGADDDASGTAVVVEAARVLGGLRPRATILFMCVAGEEQGLLGARAHAKMAFDQNRRIEAMFTNDIVGGVLGSSGKREPRRLRLFSEGNPSGPKNDNGRPPKTVVGSDNDATSRQVARYIKARGEAYVDEFEVTLIFRQDRYGRGGDHRAFNDFGYPAVRFTECHENYAWQHQNVRIENGRKMGDLPDNLDYGFVRRVCQTNVSALAEIALAPSSPRQVRVLLGRLTPHTELAWEKNPEKDIAGYGILSRRTHEPTWTHRRVVDASKTTVTLEGFSKDDWLFAVEAIDQQGRRSIPVYPKPSYGRRRR